MSKEHAYAYEAGYQDGLKAATDELKAENAKLRDEFRKMDEWHSRELLAAVDENDKLRELVNMMLRVAGVAEYATDVEWQTITHYLRELRIEVDE